MYTNEQLNDPNLFSGPEYDKQREESYNRALALYNNGKKQEKRTIVVKRKKK